MNQAYRPMAALGLIAAMCMPCSAQADKAPLPAKVAACGLEFDLPEGYRITRPKRSAQDEKLRQCSFNIVAAKPAPPVRGECKDKEAGGQPPYRVCDWVLDTGPAPVSVQVVRARLADRPSIDPFFANEEGQWMLPNAQAGEQPAQAVDFFGKPAWEGETVVRTYWSRQRTKNYTGIYGGSGGSDVTLVQLAPDILVQLQDPPADEDGTCRTFCASLRLGARTQDLP